MTYLKRAYLWTQESTLRTFVGLIVILSILGVGARFVNAASADVLNETQMYLDVSINSTQTTGIILSAPQLNGSNWTFSTTTGGVLRIRYGQYREDIYYTSATVNATTKKVTLAGVTRGICPQVARAYTACGFGRSWGKGAIVELTVDARILNLKANIDRANTFTAADGLKLSGSGTLTQPYYTTTTERDRQNPTPEAGDAACTADTGLCYDYLAGAWTARTASTVANASDSAAGKVQIITLAHLLNQTATGSTGAQNVLTPRWLSGTGSAHTNDNSANRWKLAILNATGAISASIGGTGRANVLSGSILIGQGSGAMKLIRPSTTNQVLVSTDGINVNFGSAPQDVDVLTGSLISSNTLVNNMSDAHTFNQTGSLTTTHLNTRGKMFRIYAAGSASTDSAAARISLKLGGTEVAVCSTAASTAAFWNATFIGTVRVEGASGIIEVTSNGGRGTVGCTGQNNTTSFNTTTNKTVNIGVGGDGVADFTMTQFIIESLSQ